MCSFTVTRLFSEVDDSFLRLIPARRKLEKQDSMGGQWRFLFSFPRISKGWLMGVWTVRDDEIDRELGIIGDGVIVWEWRGNDDTVLTVGTVV